MFEKMMQEHRSIRRYAEEPVSERDLATILEAGRLAPTAKNEQDIKLLVTTDPNTLDRLYEACNKQSMLKTATAFIGVATGTERVMGCQEKAGTVDASIILTCMALQAEELGYGLCWLGNFNHEKVAAAFDLPEGYKVVCVAPMGRPDESPKARKRKEMDEILIRK